MELYIHADVNIQDTVMAEGEKHDNGAGCIITDLENMGDEAVLDTSSSKALEALDKALNRKKVTSIMEPPGQCHTNVFLPASANTFHSCSALQVRESKAYTISSRLSFD